MMGSKRIHILASWLGAAAIGWILAYGAFREGLFFDADFYPIEIALIAMAAVAGVAGIWASWRRGQRLVPVWALMPFAIAGAYGIHLLLQQETVSVKGTTDSFLRWTAYGAWFVFLSVYLSARRHRKAGWVALQGALAFLLLGSWFGWFGWIEAAGTVFRSDDASLAATGARLAGYLQYPNAFGAVAAATVMIEWQLLSSRSRLATGVASLMLVPALAAVLLTESRGAMLAMLGAFLLTLVLGGRLKLGLRLATAGVSLGLAALAARSAFDTMRDGEPASGAWMLAAAWLLGAALLLALRKEAAHYWASSDSSGRMRLVPRSKRFSLVAPVWGALLFLLGCAAAYSLLARGEAGGARLDGHYETASARQLYYMDALRMFHDRPLLGAGGESWRMLAGQYKSVPYIGNEVHSGYLEILIDTGIVGFLPLIGILFYLLFKLRGRASIAWSPAALLLAHSVIDFDWGYGYVWLLLLFWLALQLRSDEGLGQLGKVTGAEREAGQRERQGGLVWWKKWRIQGEGLGWSEERAQGERNWWNEERAQGEGLGLSEGSLRSEEFKWSVGSEQGEERKWSEGSELGEEFKKGEWGKRRRSADRMGVAAATMVAALLLGFAAAALPAAWRSLAAASEHDSALAAAPPARTAQLRAALASNPAWSRVRLELAPLLPAQERVELLAQGLRYDPQYPALEFQLGMTYAELAQPEPAAAHLREALRLDRFDREAQNAAIAQMASMAVRYASAGREDRAVVAAEAAVDMFEQYRELYRTTYKGKINPWDDKEQALFSSAKFNAASAMLLLGREDEASALLKEVADESSEEWSKLAKEKLASLSKEVSS